MNPGEVKQSQEGAANLYTTAHVSHFQVDTLERDAFEVLRLVRSIKNSLAPINRLPFEVLSSIPDYCGEVEADGVSIALTHVCHSWRESLISCPSLWTRFDFMDIDKTRTYIQRSRSSPIKIHFTTDADLMDTFPLIIPHIPRLKSLTVDWNAFPNGLEEHFHCHTPLLEKLSISPYLNLDGALFNGDLSSLRQLCLYRARTDFPWKSLPNLQVVRFSSSTTYQINKLLDFLESAPLLHTVSLEVPMSDSPNAPPERIVTLRHLKFISIYHFKRPQPTFLRHLHIPLGASLVSQFPFDGDGSPLLDYFQDRSPNLCILSDITSINVLLIPDKDQTSLQLNGPSGNLSLTINWRNGPSWYKAKTLTFRFLDPLLSTTTRLAVSGYERRVPKPTAECPVFQTLASTSGLRTLVLNDCGGIDVFARALDPQQNPSNLVFCRDMEELIIYTFYWAPLGLDSLVEMAKNRALRGVKLSSITFVDRSGEGKRGMLYKLREHVTHVKYLVTYETHAWDHVPDESAGERK